MEDFRIEPIRSRAYLDGSQGETCKLRIPGVCTGDTETTVPCHVRDRHTGRGQKASDLSVIDGCRACHARFDGQDGHPLSKEDWLFYALRGIQETMENRVRRGILEVKQDKPKPLADRETKPRKPKDLRVPVAPGRPLQSAPNWPPKGSRKMQSRPFRRPEQ